jgi:hypothetical protein
VTGVEIKAGEASDLGGVKHSMIWTLNRVTGELRGDSTFNSRYECKFRAISPSIPI